jgi:hypothetical protein
VGRLQAVPPQPSPPHPRLSSRRVEHLQRDPLIRLSESHFYGDNENVGLEVFPGAQSQLPLLDSGSAEAGHLDEHCMGGSSFKWKL